MRAEPGLRSKQTENENQVHSSWCHNIVLAVPESADANLLCRVCCGNVAHIWCVAFVVVSLANGRAVGHNRKHSSALQMIGEQKRVQTISTTSFGKISYLILPNPVCFENGFMFSQSLRSLVTVQPGRSLAPKAVFVMAYLVVHFFRTEQPR